MIGDRKHVLWLLLALVLVCVMPSADSLWVDEAQTWSHVVAPDLGTWFRNLTGNSYSEALMPLGMFVAWVFGKILGTSEWALRAPNILWTALAALAFWRIGKLWRAPWAPLFLAVQPFVWYYADEARPYSLQIACGAWLTAALLEAMYQGEVQRANLLIVLGSSLVLIATTLFGIITVGAFVLVYGWLAWSRKWQLPRGWIWWTGVAFVITLACGVYYLLTLSRGAAGTTIWNAGLSNLAFAGYEFAGFAGLGPGREQLREIVRAGGIPAVLKALLPSLLPILGLSLIYLAALVRLIAFWRRRQGRDMTVALAVVLIMVVFATTALAFIANFPFWGRHIAPVFPFFAALFVLAFRRIDERRGIITEWLPLAGAMALFLLSSVQLRFAPQHRKDDYRSAAAVARKALDAGETVWWIADPQGAEYYGIPVTSASQNSENAALLLVTNHNVATLGDWPNADVVVFSKPDVYDYSGKVREFLNSGSYQLAQQYKAFTIWRLGTPVPETGLNRHSSRLE